MTPEERILRARMAAHASWAKTDNRSDRTSNARRAFLDRFEKQVDPDGTLDPSTRTLRAESARKSYYSGLALKSATSRRKKVEAREVSAVAS